MMHKTLLYRGVARTGMSGVFRRWKLSTFMDKEKIPRIDQSLNIIYTLPVCVPSLRVFLWIAKRLRCAIESFRDEKLRPWQRNKRAIFWAQEGEGFLSTIQLLMSKATLSRILTIAGNSPNEKLYCTVDPQENIQYLKGLVKSMPRRLQAVVNIKGWITKCFTLAYRSIEKCFSLFFSYVFNS